MAVWLYLAATLIVFIGIAHSYLGERYILIRLFKRDNLPKLFGSDRFTIQTLRFAWHITSLAWLGLAAVLILLASPNTKPYQLVLIIAVTFSIHGVIALVASKGKHLSWVVFFAIAFACFLAVN
ncbi:hypothetical protein ACFSJY_18605 [Thalassotalea euphylliae]|uniref:hypothetical protein n=1 Tax=Thalassotalea euphylliae TaxID=1655234 RepID=UPI00363E50D9